MSLWGSSIALRESNNNSYFQAISYQHLYIFGSSKVLLFHQNLLNSKMSVFFLPNSSVENGVDLLYPDKSWCGDEILRISNDQSVLNKYSKAQSLLENSNITTYNWKVRIHVTSCIAKATAWNMKFRKTRKIDLDFRDWHHSITIIYIPGHTLIQYKMEEFRIQCYQLAYATEIKSIQLHDSFVIGYPIR